MKMCLRGSCYNCIYTVMWEVHLEKLRRLQRDVNKCEQMRKITRKMEGLYIYK